MLYMNEYDLDFARHRFGCGQTPNRLALVMVVDNLKEWTNCHSDGWAYWPKPVRAASAAMKLIQSTTHAANNEQETADITDSEMNAVVRPIKAFLTRHKVDAEARELILRAVAS